MKTLAITHPGLEAIAADEIRELLGKDVKDIKAKAGESVVIFDAKRYEDLCLLCYKAQSLIKVLLLFDSFAFKTEEEISERAEKTTKNKEFLGFIGKKTRFRVRCTRIGEHDFESREVEEAIGKHIDGKVDLDNPEVTVYAYIFNNSCHIGIDFAGFDMSKRQYRIFNYKDSLKATFAYSLLRIADYKKTDFLLDPLCRTGIIIIEAALYATDFPVNFFSKDKFAFLSFNPLKDAKIDFEKFFEKIDKNIDKKPEARIKGYDVLLGYVKSAQKNAKIAGVNKAISVTRADIEWMDTKIKEKETDKIVTTLPEIGERSRKTGEKIYREFFYQSEFILKSKGLIVVATNSPELVEKYAKEYKFKVKNKLKAMQGKKEINIFIIENG